MISIMACACTGACRRPPYRCGGGAPLPDDFTFPPARFPSHWPAQPIVLGCVCPVGAEKTCEGVMCPRRNPYKQPEAR